MGTFGVLLLIKDYILNVFCCCAHHNEKIVHVISVPVSDTSPSNSPQRSAPNEKGKQNNEKGENEEQYYDVMERKSSSNSSETTVRQWNELKPMYQYGNAKLSENITSLRNQSFRNSLSHNTLHQKPPPYEVAVKRATKIMVRNQHTRSKSNPNLKNCSTRGIVEEHYEPLWMTTGSNGLRKHHPMTDSWGRRLNNETFEATV